MEPERCQKIERLCYSALNQERSVRAAFLAQACGGDEALRRASARRDIPTLRFHHVIVRIFYNITDDKNSAYILRRYAQTLVQRRRICTSSGWTVT